MMTIRERIQDAMKQAMKERNTFRLEALRMAKGALLLKEKSSSAAVTEEDAVAVLRGEVRKRRETADTFRNLNKEAEALGAEREIAIIEEFLPKQLSEEELEAKVRAYLAEHPEINHAGKLTGLLKKELGDAADGKMLNDVCRRALEA